MLKKFLKKLGNVLNGIHEYSYRSEAGVKVNCTEHWGSFSISVDLDDEQTKEIIRKQLEKYAKYDVVDGKLVRNDRF